MGRKQKLEDENELDRTDDVRGEQDEAQEQEGAVDEAPIEETELERALRERAEYLSNWQRSQADYQNMRRRMQQDMDGHARRSKQPLLSDILLIMDQLEMALSIPATSDDAKSFRAGIELTRDQLTRTLANEGVTAVPDDGTFDPNVHQAMSTVSTEDVAPGEIVETLRRGYTWNDIVLRHAQVRVAAAPESAGEEDASDGAQG